MDRGYIRLWRKSLDAGWIRHHKLWVFWTWCLLKATYREFDAVAGKQVIHLIPGQFIFGLRKASEETGLTIREIRTILYTLCKAGNLTIKTTNKFSVITIVNWTIYQGSDGGNDTLNDKQTTNKRQHTISKEVNNTLYRQNAQVVLAYLNEKTGKRFRDASAIEARLKDGGTVEDCKQIVNVKLRDPHFIANPRFLCPKTLFRRSHWDAYLNEAQPSAQRPEPAPGVRPVTCPACGRTVLPTDMAGPVCILCHGEVRTNA